MLIDDYLAGLEDNQRRFRNLTAHDFRKHYTNSQIFVLSPLCVSTIDDLADPAKVKKIRDNLFTPAGATWIEWRDGAIDGPAGRYGIHLVGEPDESGERSLVCGVGTFVSMRRGQYVGIPFHYNLVEGELTRLMGPIPKAELENYLGPITFAQLGPWMATALALINTPRLTE